MDPQLRRLILAENPWLRGEDLQAWIGRFLPANYIPRRLKLSADHRVVLVVGPRQAGKSTLIWKTLAEAGEPVFYLNCEEPSIREWLASPAAFLADLAEWARSGPDPVLRGGAAAARGGPVPQGAGRSPYALQIGHGTLPRLLDGRMDL